jgi:hypothetical protein
MAITVAAYWPAGSCGFVGYDDPTYVTHHPMVNQGLRSASVSWAFTAAHGANWHPLTTLSHMLDVALFGLEAGPMHWVSVLWHTLNTALVFLVWRRLSGALWPSALVAALFALHPLHVESVVWISERKDLLSTAFWLLTLLAYARWLERPTRLRYAAILIGTTFALLAKPMAVTLPGTLLLLDFWPLRRWPGTSWRSLFWEKAPLFLLTMILSVVTWRVQADDGATDFGATLTFPMRAANALVSVLRYLGKTIWPEPLSPFYPHPGWWPWWSVLGSALLIGAVSCLAWRERTRRPWLLFGWAWFLGTLMPVIGLVQVGAQSLADRYTYVPLLGIFTIVAWGGGALIAWRAALRVPLTIAAAFALAAGLAGTLRQIPYWKDGLTLVEHMRQTVGEHFIVSREKATALLIAGYPQEEIDEVYRHGRAIAPDYPYFLNELGIRAGRAGHFDEARVLLEKVRALLPRNAEAQNGLASLALIEGKSDEALRLLERSIELRPEHAPTHRLRAQIFVQLKKLREARAALREAVRCDRWDWVAWNELGVLENSLGRPSEALACFERAHWINPRDEAILRNVETLRRPIGHP